MTSLTHPADHSVAELKDALEDVDDVEALERLLEAERTGEERVTAIDAIETRLDAVAPAETSDDADDAGDADAAEEVDAAPDGEPVADDMAGGADDGPSTQNGSAVVEEGWSKDTVVGVGRPVRDEAAATNGDAPVESSRRDSPVENGGRSTESGIRAAQNGKTAVEIPDRPSKRAEAASLSTTLSGADEDVGERLLENIERIRHTFEHSTTESGRMEARVRQLQTEVGDLKAYTNALEEFLDEEGTGRQVIESVRSDIASLETSLSEVESDVGIHGRNLGSLWDVVEDVEDELSRLHERLDEQRRGLEDDIEDVEDELREVRTAADERFGEHAHRLDSLDERHEEHESRFERVDGRVDEHAHRLQSLDEQHAEHDERFEATDDRHEAHANRLDSLGDRVDGHESRFERVGDRVDEHASTLSGVDETLSTHDEALDGLDDAVDVVSERVNTVSEEVDAVETRADDAAAEVRELDNEVTEGLADGSEERAKLAERIEDNAAAIESVRATVDDLAATVESLESRLGDSGSVEGRFADVEAELEELNEWREQLSSVLLSSAGADPKPAEQ
ncbi:hypothetical protein C2R22_10690 [Salinigranum rubrum]|uniref:t-SNARE coiled-coil homology domain-containing protein n=1 Tax=Salinigranum rubrum TaxID=755307 RepID=A0A2I8VJE2_9EURY|nr:hypothetical protein [Salinigranum rubrum]AUV82057.1 hypothetical protein C2R22_10690 [Salinigranum rubrum]